VTNVIQQQLKVVDQKVTRSLFPLSKTSMRSTLLKLYLIYK